MQPQLCFGNSVTKAVSWQGTWSEKWVLVGHLTHVSALREEAWVSRWCALCPCHLKMFHDDSGMVCNHRSQFCLLKQKSNVLERCGGCLQNRGECWSNQVNFGSLGSDKGRMSPLGCSQCLCPLLYHHFSGRHNLICLIWVMWRRLGMDRHLCFKGSLTVCSGEGTKEMCILSASTFQLIHSTVLALRVGNYIIVGKLIKIFWTSVSSSAMIVSNSKYCWEYPLRLCILNLRLLNRT